MPLFLGGGNFSDSFFVNAGATAVVVLEGLTMDGGATGIAALSAGAELNAGLALYVINCTIKNNGYGVYNISTTSGARIFVQRSNLLRNQIGAAAQNSGTVISVLDSLIDGSTGTGVYANSGSIIGMARSVINASPAAIGGTGQVISIGPSNIISGTGSFTATALFN